ncbi:hypothetical protein QOZ80_3AG0219390 [Eleusine coracana subsp. coracana]|nr:hypothetical protein QOZ80_3AG0219390 [Eleusine coracana subsp. coracana]
MGIVLTGRVDLHEVFARFRPEMKWLKITCASKAAYGCGEHGQSVLEGITLYMSTDDYPHLTSSLCFTVTDDAFEGILAEFCATKKHLAEISNSVRDIRVLGNILISDQRLMVLTIHFRLRCNELIYYLVYDSRAASLSMITALPDGHEAIYTMTPVLRSDARGGDEYELAVLARKHCGPEGCIDQDVLCVCTLGTRANPGPAPDGIGPWKMIRRCSPKDIHAPFFADVMFSLDGKAFWTDLLQGMVYCDLCERNADMKFGFIGLPEQYRVDFVNDEKDTDTEPAKMSRTVGCFGSKICFVSIDRNGSCGDEVLTVWTMNVPGGKWKVEIQKTANELWELYGFEKAGLPKVAPEYPVLVPDGSLCLVLSGTPNTMECSLEDVDGVSRSETHSKSLL